MIGWQTLFEAARPLLWAWKAIGNTLWLLCVILVLVRMQRLCLLRARRKSCCRRKE